MTELIRKKSRRSRRCISVEDKLKVLQDLKFGKSYTDIVEQYGISKSQLYEIKKHEVTLKELTSTNGCPKQSKIVKNKAKHPAIDNAVFEWFCSMRALKGNRKPLPISRAIIKYRSVLEAKRLGIANFSASDGWFYRWRWRYNISKRVTLHGEAAEIDLQAAEQEVEKLRIKLADYCPDNVFNMDEAGLFFRSIPNRSYLVPDKGDVRQARRGCKSMKAKDRITVIACVNATGSCKLPPVIIGSAKKPRCFTRNPPCLPYYNQKNAWNDTVIYNKWWNEILLPTVRKHTKDPVALVLDGFSGHDDLCSDPVGQVKVFKFPPNLTSIYQPLDQGLIAALKAGYKCRVLARLVETAEKYDELQKLGSQLPAGVAGLQYGFPPHVGDAMMLLKDSWECISSSTVAACWAHSHCLSAVTTTELQNESRDYTKEVESKSIDEMCSKLGTLALGNRSVDYMVDALGLDAITKAAHQKLHDKAVDMLTMWLQLEENECIDADDEGENCEELDGSKCPVDKVQLLNEAIPLLERLHYLGAQLEDPCITDGACDMCMHVMNSTQSETH